MEQRRIISSDITASAVAHVALLTLLVLFSDVRPFGAVTAEEIPVEIVTPQELAEQQAPAEPTPAETKPAPPQPDFTRLDKPPAEATPPPSLPPAAAPPPAAASPPVTAPQKQAALAPSRATQPPPSQPAAPAYKQPEPDVSIKYQVLLGLPPDLSPMPPAPAQGPTRGEDNFDGPATEAADVATTAITAFRRHLRTCSKLPATLSGSDDVRVKLRVMMTPEGRLAAEPMLIEGRASMKGVVLMQGAIRALQDCQPYAMLPAERYGEWKVLDLSFTPQDFTNG